LFIAWILVIEWIRHEGEQRIRITAMPHGSAAFPCQLQMDEL
jgi:hypothetical protein